MALCHVDGIPIISSPPHVPSILCQRGRKQSKEADTLLACVLHCTDPKHFQNKRHLSHSNLYAPVRSS